MKKLIIEEVSVNVSEGGMACGPVSGNVVVEVRVRDDSGKDSYHGLVECDGIPNIYASGVSRYRKELAMDYAEGEVFPSAEDYSCYEEFYQDFDALAARDLSHALLLKYLICLARLGWDEVEALKAASVGKPLGSFDIPVCDAEEEYLEMCEEEEGEE